jgi:hypothetical protein
MIETNCGHMFCETCIHKTSSIKNDHKMSDKFITIHSPCYSCKGNIVPFIKLQTLNRKINNLQVICKFCNMHIVFSDYLKHNMICTEQIVICPCGEEFIRKNKEKHNLNCCTHGRDIEKIPKIEIIEAFTVKKIFDSKNEELENYKEKLKQYEYEIKCLKYNIIENEKIIKKISYNANGLEEMKSMIEQNKILTTINQKYADHILSMEEIIQPYQIDPNHPRYVSFKLQIKNHYFSSELIYKNNYIGIFCNNSDNSLSECKYRSIIEICDYNSSFVPIDAISIKIQACKCNHGSNYCRKQYYDIHTFHFTYLYHLNILKNNGNTRYELCQNSYDKNSENFNQIIKVNFGELKSEHFFVIFRDIIKKLNELADVYIINDDMNIEMIIKEHYLQSKLL